MLEIIVPDKELWDEANEQFINFHETKLELEHSLVAISKWEAKWHKPFLSKYTQKSNEEVIDYIRCMTLTPNVDQNIYKCLTKDNITQIDDYINNPMTATTIKKIQTENNNNNREQITSELIYYWMLELKIPVEFQNWHINRLITLIELCEVKNTPPKKLSRAEIMRRNEAINAANRKRFKSKG